MVNTSQLNKRKYPKGSIVFDKSKIRRIVPVGQQQHYCRFFLICLYAIGFRCTDNFTMHNYDFAVNIFMENFLAYICFNNSSVINSLRCKYAVKFFVALTAPVLFLCPTATIPCILPLWDNSFVAVTKK